MRTFRLRDAAHLAIHVSDLANGYLTETAPWSLYKQGKREEADVILRTALELCYIAAHLLEPFLPAACEKTFNILNTPRSTLLKLTGNDLTAGIKLKPAEPLFPRIGDNRHDQSKKGTNNKQQSWKEAKAAKDKAKQAQKNASKMITRLEFKVGKILSVKNHPGADSLFIEEIDLGEEKPRQIVSGLREFYTAEQLSGQLVVVFTNLKGGKIRGEESNGMVLCASNKPDGVEILSPPEAAQVGERIFFKGVKIDSEPDKKVSSRKKNSPWVACKPDLKTNGKLVATFKGKPFMTTAGPCLVKSLANIEIA